jgi:hypothetical protein
MECQSCGKGFAEWQCKDCGKLVCTNCVRNTPNGVYCNGCYEKQKVIGENPNVDTKKSKKNLSGLKKVLIMLIVLDIGLALIFFIGNYFIGQMNVEFGQNYVAIFQQFGETLLYGIIGITIVLFILYIIFDRFL